MMDKQPKELAKAAKLRQLLIDCFNEGELRTLCFDIEIDYENLPGQSKADKARELVAYVKRQGQIALLLTECQRIRPNVDWWSVVTQIAPPERLRGSLQKELLGLVNKHKRVAFLVILVVSLMAIASWPISIYLRDTSSFEHELMITMTAEAKLLDEDNKTELLVLDSYDPQDSSDVGPIRSSIVLANEKRYRVIISGTWSTWRRGAWTNLCSGKPEERPQYNSSRVNGNVGVDAAFVFARPKESSLCGQKEVLPSSISGQLPMMIKTTDSNTWEELLPDNREYNPLHIYTYTIVGKGAPIELKIFDDHTMENYGVLKVYISGPLK